MGTSNINWDEEFEREALARRSESDKRETPEMIEARKQKAEREFQRGVELGWHDADGNSFTEDKDDEDDEDDEGINQ